MTPFCLESGKVKGYLQREIQTLKEFLVTLMFAGGQESVESTLKWHRGSVYGGLSA